MIAARDLMALGEKARLAAQSRVWRALEAALPGVQMRAADGQIKLTAARLIAREFGTRHAAETAEVRAALDVLRSDQR